MRTSEQKSMKTLQDIEACPKSMLTPDDVAGYLQCRAYNINLAARDCPTALGFPVCFIGTVAVLTLIFPKGDGGAFNWMAYELLTGGLMLGAIFMATDYASSPVTPKGQIIYGIGCGVLTVLIRYFGSYPEGVSYAILIMNCCVFLIEKISQPVKFGYVKPVKAPKAEKEAAK